MNQQLIYQGGSYDPNWLFSTTAQATAALLAIIGGFLISRLISILAEKSQQIQSLAELRNRDRVNKFPASIAQSCIEMRADGVRIESPHDEEIFERVAAHISSLRLLERVDLDDELHMRGNERESPVEMTSESDHASPDFVFERRDAAIKERDRLNEELGVIHGKIELIESHLPAMAQTKRLIQGFMILAYFSLVGIVYPLYLMTRNPVVATASERTYVLMGFISGLLALLVFIWKSVADLQGIEKHLARVQKER